MSGSPGHKTVRRTRGDSLLLFWVAAADLRHEALLSLCLVLSIAAVCAPLLTLYGLKHGVVQTMRGRLLNDCKIREIIPKTSLNLPPAWYTQTAARSDVAFLVPTTRQISLGVEGSLKDGNHLEPFDLIPSAANDPLIAEPGKVSVPALGPSECVLSAEAARKLGATVGNSITVYVKRTRKDKDSPQISSTNLRVCGLLSPAATPRSVCLVHLTFAEGVETYRDGYAVSDYGWDGDRPRLEPEFDGVAVAGGALEPDFVKQLLQITGATAVRNLKPPESATLFASVPSGSIWLFESMSGGVNMRTLQTIAGILGKAPEPLLYQPYVRPMRAKLQLAIESRDILIRAADHVGFLPPGTSLGVSPTDIAVPVVPLSVAAPQNSRLILESPFSQIEVPFSTVTLGAVREEGTVFVHWRIAGLLNAASKLPAEFDSKLGLFLRKRAAYAGFRLYARSIEDVARVRDTLEAQGIPVYTQLDKIADVKTIDRNLGILLALVGSLAFAGGCGVLISTLVSAVERKRQPLSVLMLLGVAPWKLCLIPLYQSSIAIFFAMSISFGAYRLCAWIVDRIFSASLQQGESFCYIPPEQIGTLLLGMLALGWLVSLLALPLLKRLPISANIRDE